MSEVLDRAYNLALQKHPNASTQHQYAFANSVSYLVTGESRSYGSPSIRDHCVSWSLAGDGYNCSEVITIQFPDGRLPRPGNWTFDRACEFCDPIVFGNLPAIASRIYETEYCFNDDPNDIEELKRRTRGH